MGKERKAIEYIGRRKDKWWYQMNPTRTGRPGSFLLGEKKANYEPSLFFCEMRRWVMNSSAYSRIQVSSSALWKGRRQRRWQQQQHGKRETRHHVWKRHSMKSAKLFLYGRWNERDGRGGNKNILYKYLLFFLLLLVRCVLSIIETVALRNRTGGKLEPVTPVGAIPMSQRRWLDWLRVSVSLFFKFRNNNCRIS